MPAEDVSEVEALAGGEMLQHWLLHFQGKLRQSKLLQLGTTQLLRALQQARLAPYCAPLLSCPPDIRPDPNYLPRANELFLLVMRYLTKTVMHTGLH